MYCKIKVMKKLLTILVVLFIGSMAFAQSADVVTDILNTEEVTYGQVCYLSAIHQGLISENASYEDAINVLYEKGQIKEDVGSYDSVFMANLAFIFAQIWPDAKGGVMYRLTNGSPRYAFKKFKNDGIFDSDADPNSYVSGSEALAVLTSCMVEYGAADECMQMDVE